MKIVALIVKRFFTINVNLGNIYMRLKYYPANEVCMYTYKNVYTYVNVFTVVTYIDDNVIVNGESDGRTIGMHCSIIE